MYVVAMIGILIAMGLALVRAAKGPTTADRILAGNMFSTKIVLLVAVVGFLNGRPDFLDLALVYALINFIDLVAVVKFARFGNLARDDEKAPWRT